MGKKSEPEKFWEFVRREAAKWPTSRQVTLGVPHTSHTEGMCER